MKRRTFHFRVSAGLIDVNIILCRRGRWRIEPESRELVWSVLPLGNLMLALSAGFKPGRRGAGPEIEFNASQSK